MRFPSFFAAAESITAISDLKYANSAVLPKSAAKQILGKIKDIAARAMKFHKGASIPTREQSRNVAAHTAAAEREYIPSLLK